MISKFAAVAVFGVLLGLSVRAPAVLVCTAIIVAAIVVAAVSGKADAALVIEMFVGVVVLHACYLVGVFVRQVVRSWRDR